MKRIVTGTVFAGLLVFFLVACNTNIEINDKGDNELKFAEIIFESYVESSLQEIEVHLDLDEEEAICYNILSQIAELSYYTTTPIEVSLENPPIPQIGGSGYHVPVFRPLFWRVPYPFARFVGMDAFRDWAIQRGPDYEDLYDSGIVNFINYFNISDEDFIRLNEEWRQNLISRGRIPNSGSQDEIFPVELILSFDNEAIREFFLWENSPNPDERDRWHNQFIQNFNLIYLDMNVPASQEELAPFGVTGTSYEIVTVIGWDPGFLILSDLNWVFNMGYLNLPTINDYIFVGWYLNSDLTTPLTETFRMPAQDITLYARWEFTGIAYPTITFNQTGQGTITATILDDQLNQIELTSGDTVFKGTPVTFTATPEEGWQVVGWSINGVPYQGLGYGLGGVEDCQQGQARAIVRYPFAHSNIHVFFAPMHDPIVTFTHIGQGSLEAITAPGPAPFGFGTNPLHVLPGSILVSGNVVPLNTHINFTAIPADGWRLLAWYVNGTILLEADESTGGALSWTASEDLHVRAYFTAPIVEFGWEGVGDLSLWVTSVSAWVPAGTGVLMPEDFDLLPYLPEPSDSFPISLISGSTVPYGTPVTFVADIGIDIGINLGNSGHVRLLAWYINGQLYQGGTPSSITITLEGNLDVRARFSELGGITVFDPWGASFLVLESDEDGQAIPATYGKFIPGEQVLLIAFDSIVSGQVFGGWQTDIPHIEITELERFEVMGYGFTIYGFVMPYEDIVIMPNWQEVGFGGFGELEGDQMFEGFEDQDLNETQNLPPAELLRQLLRYLGGFVVN